jgi:hypothetical protein
MLFMEEMLVQNETLSTTEQNLLAYFETHDVKYVTEDAKFRNLSTGEVHTGRAEIGAMLHFIYHVAFDAKAEVRNYFFTEEKAVLEGFFKGRHIGEIAGMPATNKEVDVPFSVAYDLENGLIKEARIYMLFSVMMEQLGLAQSPQNT